MKNLYRYIIDFFSPLKSPANIENVVITDPIVTANLDKKLAELEEEKEKFNQTKQKKIAKTKEAYLKKKGFQCPCCTKKKWYFASDRSIYCISGITINNKNNMERTEKGSAVIQLICNNCGYTIFFATNKDEAIALGLS